MNAPMPPAHGQDAPAAAPAQALLQALKDWSERGLLRRLDWAFAQLLAGLDPAARAPVLLAAALTAHLEGRGHSCLLLDEAWRDAPGLLGWSPAATAEHHLLAAHLPGSVADWLQGLQGSPLVAMDDGEAAPPGDRQPLVLRGHKLYLRRHWRYERQVAARVLQRVADPDPVDEVAARGWLDRLFPAPPPPASSLHAEADHLAASKVASQVASQAEPGPGAAPVDWQKIACAVALRGRLSVMTGGPGTGKTYTAARLLALLLAIDPEPQRLRVALAAPTGKAAARLKQSIGDALQGLEAQLQGHLPAGLSLTGLVARMGAARTLHSLLGARPDTRRFQADAAHPLAVDVLIVDEASMVHLEMMAALLEALAPRARLILLGDKDQLASVEAGAVLGDLCREAEQGAYRAETARYIDSVCGQLLPARYRLDGPAQQGLAFGGEPASGSALAQQTVMLRTSRRFGGPIGRLALAANAGEVLSAHELLKKHAGRELQWLDSSAAEAVVELALHGRPGAEGGYAGPGSYLAQLALRPKAPAQPEPAHRAAFEAWVLAVLTAFERFRLLCAVREGDWGASGLNTAIERALVARGLLPGRGEWYEGRPVMVTRNDPGVGVFNGDIGVVLRPLGATATGAAAAPLRAWFLDGQAVRSVSVSRLAQVDTAFALTVHKSQGSEFEHTVLVLPQEPSRVLTRELVYTGITRARSAFTLATGRRAALAEALGHRTQRASGLVELLAPRRPPDD